MSRSFVAEDVRTRPEATKKGERRLKVSLVFFPLFVIALSAVTIVASAVWEARGAQELAAAISAGTHETAVLGRYGGTIGSGMARFDPNHRACPLSQIKEMYQWHLTSPARAAVTVAGWAALLTALLALVMGTSIIRQIRGMAVTARRSRDALLESFTLGIRRLPWWLTSFTSIFAISVLLLTVASFAAPMVFVAESGCSGRNADPLALATSIAAMVFGLMSLTYSFFSIRGAFRVRQVSRAAFVPEPLAIMGRNIAENEAPVLWRLVRDVAARAGAAMPERIMVGLNEGFFVTENPVALSGGQTFAGGRTLYLPLTYLAFMTRPEMEAVIGHELGHFVGEDSQYSIRFAPLFHRASISMIATHATRRDLRGVEATLCEYFMAAFQEAVRHWGRLRELAADQIGAGAAGADAMASALLRIAAVSPRVDEALEICRRGGADAGRGVLSQLSRLVAEKGMADPEIDLGDQQPHPFDSHPPLRQRVAAVGVAITSGPLQDARDARPGTLLAELQLSESEPGADSRGDHRRDPAAGAVRPTPQSVVEDEFSGVFGEERRKRIAWLGLLAAQGVEPLPLYRLSARLAFLGLPFGGILMAGAVTLVRSGALGYGLLAALFALFMLVGGLVSISRDFLPIRPVLVLDRDALTVCAIGIVIPWTEMADVAVSRIFIYGFIRVGIRTIITLAPGKELPSGWKHWSMYTAREGNRLRIEVGRFRKMPGKKFAETLIAYWHGGMARQDLARLEATPEEIAIAVRSEQEVSRDG